MFVVYKCLYIKCINLRLYLLHAISKFIVPPIPNYSHKNIKQRQRNRLSLLKITEGKKTPSENGHCSFKITLRSPNATVIRTNFHGLAIDSTLVCLDFDKLLCSVCFDTKFQQNGKLFFHVSYIGVSADWLRICKNASVLRVRPSALMSYFNWKRHSVWGWIPNSFS